jgi:low molecular weight phosphotyrosine protein phosphatase
MTRKKVLFVCVHNSARSQMAEAFLVISVRDDAAEREDPSTFKGTREERLAKTRIVRDQTRDEIGRFCAKHCRSLPQRSAV